MLYRLMVLDQLSFSSYNKTNNSIRSNKVTKVVLTIATTMEILLLLPILLEEQLILEVRRELEELPQFFL